MSQIKRIYRPERVLLVYYLGTDKSAFQLSRSTFGFENGDEVQMFCIATLVQN